MGAHWVVVASQDASVALCWHCLMLALPCAGVSLYWCPSCLLYSCCKDEMKGTAEMRLSFEADSAPWRAHLSVSLLPACSVLCVQVNRKIGKEEMKAMEELIMHNGVKKQLEQLLARRKSKRSYEYEVKVRLDDANGHVLWSTPSPLPPPPPHPSLSLSLTLVLALVLVLVLALALPLSLSCSPSLSLSPSPSHPSPSPSPSPRSTPSPSSLPPSLPPISPSRHLLSHVSLSNFLC